MAQIQPIDPLHECIEAREERLMQSLDEPEVVTLEQKQDFVRKVWLTFLGRTPDPEMLAQLVQRLDEGRSPIEFFLDVEACQEAVERRNRVHEFVPPGHYYSPVVNPEALKVSSFEERRRSDQLSGLTLDFSAMEEILLQVASRTNDLSFPATATDGHRFYYQNDMFGLGDAIILAGMIRLMKPARIIEVGSGFSSAVMLDTLDRTPQVAAPLTFIEPYPERLRKLLRQQDEIRVDIIEKGVQEVAVEVFEQLGCNDILFLDTTHISKTGSDVNHEIFEILPRLAPGVVVHFHDIFDCFEYPSRWIYDENRSWNELYILRSFLMYNDTFEVIFFNDAFARRKAAFAKQNCPRFMQNPGGGLWLRKKG
ncbi:class I SAM-dependent methyltransferase [Microvirga sp. GCM10011540]|uniref:class I SAM-dependent methyltransferase n=1 Tax=Microvirga sp. GCM10011540 TaxID=3317338 RepID=UPI003614719D